MNSTPIYSSAPRDHIQRVFLDSVFSLVFSITLESNGTISSGKGGVHGHPFVFSEEEILFFPEENEEAIYGEFLHRSWPEFNRMNLWWMRIVVLAVVLVLPYVQCTFSLWKIV